jgi:DNA-directed RNA polymerase specialized sigma24 family protein
MPRTSARKSSSRRSRGWPPTATGKVDVSPPGQQPTAPLDDPPSPEPGLLAAVEKGEDLQRLARLLARFDEGHQELLRLRYSAGLSFAQIGLLEGRSEAAVKMAVYRALDFLRAHWEDEDG